MIFKCDNCGGNVVFDPDQGRMHCPHCDGIDSQKKVTGEQSMERCINCGAPVTVTDYMSSAQCEHCGCYIIFDERVEGKYRPHLMVPFAVSKNRAKEIMRERFKKKAFAPSDFLRENMLEKMTGIYVPFFLYDLNVRCKLWGEGVRRRVWRSGDTEYTENSYYIVDREMYADFDRIPVDASIAMDDGVMDLMEPYNYTGLQDFKEEFMSGFSSEIYNNSAGELRERASKKAVDSAVVMLNESVTGYSSFRVLNRDTSTQDQGTQYALMPVWNYVYNYRGQTYQYYINGQTGKVVGTTPVSKGKVAAYGATVWGFFFLILTMIKFIGGL